MKKFLQILMLVAVLTVTFMCEAKTIFTYSGSVVNVYDGDTITVLDAENQKHKVRFYAIDAPEIKQEGGRESFINLLDLLDNIPVVRVEVQNIDLYGREVAVVYADKLNLNRQQVADGYAWHYKQYDRLFKEEFAALEQLAREKKIGIWTNPDTQAPWEFRKSRRNATAFGGVK